MPEGGKIVIDAEVTDKNIIISVEDSGCGINKENLDKVFNPFFTTKKEGNGLGLNLVYQTMNFHQGNIDIESRENIGTKVVLSFPKITGDDYDFDS